MNKEHYNLLIDSVEDWNQWVKKQPITFQADLSGADLIGANLTRANLFRANLSEIDLSEADLSGANLIEANLTRANLFRANLSKVDLYGSDLYGSDLSESELFHTNLYGANLFKVDFYRANLTGVRGIISLNFDKRGFTLIKYKRNGNRFLAGCHDFTYEQALDHWGSSEYPDKERGKMYVSSVTLLNNLENE